jgi:hypothetical protein
MAFRDIVYASLVACLLVLVMAYANAKLPHVPMLPFDGSVQVGAPK